MPLPVDPERLRREFPELTDADLRAYAEVTRRVLADPRSRGRVLAQVMAAGARAAARQGAGQPPDAEELEALAYAAALRKMQSQP